MAETGLTLDRILADLVDGVTGGLVVVGEYTLAGGIFWAKGGAYNDLRSLVASCLVFWKRDFGWLEVPPGERFSLAEPGEGRAYRRRAHAWWAVVYRSI